MHRAEWWHKQSWQQNCSSNMASTWSRMIKWKILTTKLLFKHGMVFTWSSASSSWVLVWNLLKSFWNYHYSERSTFEIIIIQREVLLKSSLFREKYFWNHHYSERSTFEIIIIKKSFWDLNYLPPAQKRTAIGVWRVDENKLAVLEVL